jgi:acetate---CoA ligase (ADP-forming)
MSNSKTYRTADGQANEGEGTQPYMRPQGTSTEMILNDLSRSRELVAALTAPRNVVLVGATDRPGSWSARVWSNLSKYGFTGRIFLMNAKRDELWGQRCYHAFADLPEPPDHMAVMLPASSVPEVLREGAAAGARSATIYAAGFGEGHDEEGQSLRIALEAAIAETGLGVSGPNCLGNASGRSRLVTLVDNRPIAVAPGPVALVGQSGGVMIFLSKALEERGMQASYIITSGNEIGLSMPDYINFFATDPDVRIILCYMEAVSDFPRFAAACEAARRANKPIIAIKLGTSDAGRAAAMAHTGSLAGAAEVFDAVAGDLGVIRAHSLDDAVELAELLLHTGAPIGPRAGALTLSGAFRGLLLDAADRSGMRFPELSPATVDRLGNLPSVGTILGNPLDGGFAILTNLDTFLSAVDALQADPGIDILLIQEELPREPTGAERAISHLRAVERYVAEGRASKPIAFISLLTHNQTEFSRTLRHELRHVSFLTEANKVLRVVGQAASSVANQQLREAVLATTKGAEAPVPPIVAELLSTLHEAAGPVAVDEIRSKAVLNAFGIATPREAVAHSAGESSRLAREIGFPVVLKVIAEGLAHKSDVGGVLLGLSSAEAVERGYEQILANLRTHGVTAPVEGVLVCTQVAPGPELVLGLHRDREMGLVAMAGSGGVLLELVRDVVFSGLPLDQPRARALIQRTSAATLLAGYRGGDVRDLDAVVDALVALSRIAASFGDHLETIEINPFLPLKKGNGGLALDALLVLRPCK